MQRKAPVYDRAFAVNKSSMAHHYFTELLKKAKAAEQDTDKKLRLTKHECKSCFYVFRDRIGGAAMTNQNCALCHEPQMYASTNTDVLCRSCAIDESLCKRCGGDLDMRERRRNWPTPQSINYPDTEE